MVWFGLVNDWGDGTRGEGGSWCYLIGELLKITKLYPEDELDEPRGLWELFCVVRIKQTHGDPLALWSELHTCCLIVLDLIA